MDPRHRLEFWEHGIEAFEEDLCVAPLEYECGTEADGPLPRAAQVEAWVDKPVSLSITTYKYF